MKGKAMSTPTEQKRDSGSDATDPLVQEHRERRETLEAEFTAGTTMDRSVEKSVNGRPGTHYPGKLGFKIASLPAPIYLILAGITLIAGLTGSLQPSMLTGFAITILFGGLLIWIGNLIPKIRDYGLPTILCAFVPGTLLFYGLVPENMAEAAATFVTDQGFLDYFVISVIAGSILGMPRKLLAKAGPRFAIPLIGCLILTFTVVGLIATTTGRDFVEGMLFFAAPAVAGGLGLGALPMSEMYAAQLGGASEDFFGDLMSVTVLANLCTILFAGALNGFSKNRPKLFVGFNGKGELLRIKGKSSDLRMPKKRDASSFIALAQGLLITSGLFVVGNLLGDTIGGIHPYAWTIIAAALVKLLKLLPQNLEDATSDWGEMINVTLVPALLVGVSLAYIDIEAVIASVSNPEFILLTVSTVIVSSLTAGILGWLAKFNFVEISIIPGLVMADSGGSGDVSVLAAAERMHLMPFAALATRLGGTITLFMATLLVPLLA